MEPHDSIKVPRDAAAPSVRLLRDTPADEDEFGSHGRVASAIASLIRHDDQGKAIALKGHWGSGKSTVIKFVLADLIKDTPDHDVFVFDAWSHQSDPLRRAFLEELISFLRLKGRVQPDSGSKAIETFAKRLKIETTHETPRLTLGGAFIAISALFVPLGLAVIARQDLSVVWSVVGAMLATLPIWAFLECLWLRSRGVDVFKTKGSSTALPWHDIVSLLVSKPSSEVRTETVETADPTSIEFQREFQTLASEALSSAEGRKLVIIIDNLDRVDVM